MYQWNNDLAKIMDKLNKIEPNILITDLKQATLYISPIVYKKWKQQIRI